MTSIHHHFIFLHPTLLNTLSNLVRIGNDQLNICLMRHEAIHFIILSLFLLNHDLTSVMDGILYFSFTKNILLSYHFFFFFLFIY